MTCPRILALFQKRIEGDNALLELAGMRFREAGLGAEFYAETTAELDWLLRFKPLPDSPAAVHLHRWINVFEEESRKLIIEFAERYKERIFGIVIHDQSEIVSRPGEYVACLHELESGLKKVGGPCLFIEYAVGLEPEVFIGLFKEIQELKYVSACIDSGHIGLWQARCTYLRFHPGKNIFSLKADNPDLPGVIEDVESAVSSAPGMVLHVIREIARLRKPLHFHLHDAHPASVSSPFGISDHLSFVDRVPIPFEYKGKRYLDPMFGPSGLRNIITEGMHSTGPDLLSFTLEIHPAEGRLPLGNASRLFSRWKDKGNAERMNFWLSVLQRNQKIILKTCGIKEVDMEKGEGMIIYNLFPLLAGKFTEWVSHLERASEMGFTWVFVNPIQMPGSSGSIYSIKDYFSLNPLLVDDKSKRSPVEQVKDMTKAAGKLGLRTMVDLVINHCSIDSALVKSHPEWFAREPNGSIAHPFADENGKKVIWKDLVKFDHRNTRDREGLFRFFLDVV
jgi:hypothetical protein